MSYFLTPFARHNRIARNLDRYFETTESQWIPQVDVTETSDAYVLTADLPGVSPDNISISVDKGVLSIEGSRTLENGSDDDLITRRERVSGSFKRRFSLPDAADVNGVNAESDNGVLRIYIAKLKDAQPLTIEVKAA